MTNEVSLDAPYLLFAHNTVNFRSWSGSSVRQELSPLAIRLPHIHSAVYSVLTELPAVFVLYDSPFWSGAFLIFIFAVSVWNGGGFYIEVFGRK